jgi:hypothetical protein
MSDIRFSKIKSIAKGYRSKVRNSRKTHMDSDYDYCYHDTERWYYKHKKYNYQFIQPNPHSYIDIENGCEYTNCVEEYRRSLKISTLILDMVRFDGFDFDYDGKFLYTNVDMEQLQIIINETSALQKTFLKIAEIPYVVNRQKMLYYSNPFVFNKFYFRYNLDNFTVYDDDLDEDDDEMLAFGKHVYMAEPGYYLSVSLNGFNREHPIIPKVYKKKTAAKEKRKQLYNKGMFSELLQPSAVIKKWKYIPYFKGTIFYIDSRCITMMKNSFDININVAQSTFRDIDSFEEKYNIIAYLDTDNITITRTTHEPLWLIYYKEFNHTNIVLDVDQSNANDVFTQNGHTTIFVEDKERCIDYLHRKDPVFSIDGETYILINSMTISEIREKITHNIEIIDGHPLVKV